MKHLLLVGLGGGLGAIARYKLGGWVLHQTMSWRFPAGTFVVNVLGCLVAGLLAAYVERRDLLGPETRLLLFTGVLGGFTTFSAFALDTTLMWERHDWMAAAIYAGSSVLLSIAGLIAGMFIVRIPLS